MLISLPVIHVGFFSAGVKKLFGGPVYMEDEILLLDKLLTRGNFPQISIKIIKDD